MESHTELIGLFLPELAAAVAPSAAATLPSAVAEGALPSDLDFLALLEQELNLRVDSPPTDQQTPRQLLPIGGQTLPPLVPLATLSPQPQELLVADTLPKNSVVPTLVTAMPSIARQAKSGDMGSTVLAKVPLEAATVSRTPPPVPVAADSAPLVPVPSAEVAAVAARLQTLPKQSGPAKPPTAAALLNTDAAQVDAGRRDVDPLGSRPAGQLIEPEPSRNSPPGRFDSVQPGKPDLASPLPSHSVSSPASSVIPPAPMLAPEAASPVTRTQAHNIPATFPEIVDSVRTLTDQKGGEMRLRLNPPELGHLDIKVRVSDEQTFVSITANNSFARDTLEQHIGRLRTLLDAAGLNLADAHVSSERHSQQSSSGDLPEWASVVSPTTFVEDEGAAALVDEAESAHGIDLFA